MVIRFWTSWCAMFKIMTPAKYILLFGHLLLQANSWLVLASTTWLPKNYKGPFSVSIPLNKISEEYLYSIIVLYYNCVKSNPLCGSKDSNCGYTNSSVQMKLYIWQVSLFFKIATNLSKFSQLDFPDDHLFLEDNGVDMKEVLENIMLWYTLLKVNYSPLYSAFWEIYFLIGPSFTVQGIEAGF